MEPDHNEQMIERLAKLSETLAGGGETATTQKVTEALRDLHADPVGRVGSTTVDCGLLPWGPFLDGYFRGVFVPISEKVEAWMVLAEVISARRTHGPPYADLLTPLASGFEEIVGKRDSSAATVVQRVGNFSLAPTPYERSHLLADYTALSALRERLIPTPTFEGSSREYRQLEMWGPGHPPT